VYRVHNLMLIKLLFLVSGSDEAGVVIEVAEEVPLLSELCPDDVILGSEFGAEFAEESDEEYAAG
jgi:hypothetical protein